ncbi:MAG: proton-conducting transporter membrane subunit, partial [Betaproteobacteria bacterium]|nr:proton-conducting transporter membrane subunit [Betaproteobacteria bacterium]
MSELLALAILALLLAALLALLLPSHQPTRVLAVLGGGGVVAACAGTLLRGDNLRIAGIAASHFTLDGAGVWLSLFGAIAATPALALGSPDARRRVWYVGAIAVILGALGVMGVQSGVAFLIAWELMSLGSAVMLLAERLGIEADEGRAALTMLALLEVGAVALLAAWLIFALLSGSMAMDGFAASVAGIGGVATVGLGLLLLIGFGAKLGLLPFYEWFAGAYASGSGASASLMSGIVLNAAWFALARGLLVWLQPSELLGIVTVAVAALSAILAVLYALQADDW